MEPPIPSAELGQGDFSIIPHLLAGVISFFALWLLPPALVDAGYYVSNEIELDFSFLSPIIVLLGGSFALVSAFGFMFCSIGLDHFGRQKRISAYVPYIAAFPLMWAVCLPEAVTSDDSPRAWMLFGTLIAAAFCMHWFVVQAVARKLN